MPETLTATTAITLRGLHKRFNGGPVVLDGVDLDIRKGEIVGIIGRSGAGKSTLVRLLNGLETPDSGDVIVDGVDVGALSGAGLNSLRHRVQMIFQHFGLLWSRSVAQNVALPLKIAGYDAAEIARRVPALLARVGLSDYADAYPAQLSGGQKQRVGIARALATEPSILLCDEATSALDPETTATILELLADLNRELGLTIIVITHEMDVVRRICDRVAVLSQGQVVESGSVAEIFLHATAPATQALIREEGSAEFDALVAAFDGLVVDFTVEGDAALQPVLSDIIRDSGIAVTLLSARVGRFRQGNFGQFTLGLQGSETETALAALSRYGKVTRHAV